MENKLNISALKKAAEAFYNVLTFANKVEAKSRDKCEFYEFESARASLIQHFEICYELCWKMMKRFIEMDIGEEADILTRKDLFRVSAQKRLIADFHNWLEFHSARNITSHIYGEDAANDVYQAAKKFADDLQEFVETFRKQYGRLCFCCEQAGT